MAIRSPRVTASEIRPANRPRLILISRMDQEQPSYSGPERRQGPPWAMEEMIAAEPALVSPTFSATAQAAPIAALIRTTAQAGQPVVVTGCGTSESAAIAVAELILESLYDSGLKTPIVRSEQALEASFQPWHGGACIGISHGASTRATVLAMEAA